MAALDLTMVLKLNDRASKKMQAFNRVLDKTVRKLEKINKLQSKGQSAPKGGSGGAASTGLGTVGVAGAAGLTTAATTGFATVSGILITLSKAAIKVEVALQAMITAAKFGQGPLKSLGDAAEIVDKQFENVDVAIRKAGKTIESSANKTEKAGKAAKKSGEDAAKGASGWRKYATAIKVAIGALVGIVLKNMVSTGIEFEKMRATLSAVIPATDNVGEAFAFITSVSQKLPSTLQEVTTAFIRMQALGLAPTEEKLLSFGNTAAASGKSVLQFVEAVADAVVGENERLKEFGIKARVSGDKVAFTFRNVTTEVDNTSKAISNFLVGIGKTGAFAGAAEKQMNTLDGQISNLGVTWDILSDLLTQTFAPAMKIILSLTSKFVNAMSIGLVFIRKQAVNMIAAFDQMGLAIANFLAQLFKSEAQQKIIQALYEKDIASSNARVAAIHAELDALIDIDKAAKKYSKTLDERAKKQEKSALGMQIVARHTQTLAEFMVELDNAVIDADVALENMFNAQSELNDMFQRGEIDAGEFNDRLTLLNEMMGVELPDSVNELSEFWKQAFRNMQSDLANFFTDITTKQFTSFTDGMKQLASDFAQTINRMVAQWLAAKILTGGFGAFGIDVGGNSPRGFADGGRPPMNVPSIVGERGPELFVPDSAGTIVSNEAMSAKTVQVNITAMDSQDVMRSLEQNKRGITEMVFGTQSTFNLGAA